MNEFRLGAKYSNPIGLTILCVRLVSKAIPAIAHEIATTWRNAPNEQQLRARTKETIVALWKVIRLTYRYVHSDLRALCFIDGMIGAAIGFYANGPLIGLLAGLALGVVNYLVVGRWWLGLHRA